MVNNPDHKLLSLAQVGFSFNDVNTSLIGVRIDRRTELMTSPRVVILEPEAASNTYNDLHNGYEKIVNELREKLDGKEHLLRLIKGDIYKPETLTEIPSLAFIVLEDVLSDPYFKGDKDFEKLTQILEQRIVSGGMVLTLDSKLSYFSNEVQKTVQKFLEITLASGNFTLALELIDFEWGLENIEKRDSQKVREKILTELEKMSIVDEALKEGLQTLRLGIYHCLVLQRV